MTTRRNTSANRVAATRLGVQSRAMRIRAAIPLTLCLLAAACGPLPDVDWPLNGGLDNIRYSPLSEITRDNVAQLRSGRSRSSPHRQRGRERVPNERLHTYCC